LEVLAQLLYKGFKKENLKTTLNLVRKAVYFSQGHNECMVLKGNGKCEAFSTLLTSIGFLPIVVSFMFLKVSGMSCVHPED
jgi:hypothetical protein